MISSQKEDPNELREVIRGFPPSRNSLIPLLQFLQDRYGFIPPHCLDLIADHLGLFPAEVQGVVTFYAQFSLVPKGRHIVKVCRGTACHVRGGKSILRVAEEYLGIKEGETTRDFCFTLETVACLGTCFLAPVVMVDRSYYGKLVPPQVKSILREYEKR
mgnify:CR=1 FL=1